MVVIKQSTSRVIPIKCIYSWWLPAWWTKHVVSLPHESHFRWEVNSRPAHSLPQQLRRRQVERWRCSPTAFSHRRHCRPPQRHWRIFSASPQSPPTSDTDRFFVGYRLRLGATWTQNLDSPWKDISRLVRPVPGSFLKNRFYVLLLQPRNMFMFPFVVGSWSWKEYSWFISESQITLINNAFWQELSAH